LVIAERSGQSHSGDRRTLELTLKSPPIGTGYGIWTGIGVVATARRGIALPGEPATAVRLASIGLILAGILGFKLVT
jgi:quaternary ammonium compound-resistance protein SugE